MIENPLLDVCFDFAWFVSVFFVDSFDVVFDYHPKFAIVPFVDDLADVFSSCVDFMGAL